MRLELESGRVIDDVTEADLRDAVEAEEFAILHADEPHTYIQCAEQHEPPYEYDLEYRDGSADRHYEAVDHPIALERVLAALTKYLRGDASWRDDFRWEKLDLSAGGRDAGPRELLAEVRGHYLGHLAEAIEEMQQETGATVLTEVALRDEGGAAVSEGVLDLPLRMDLAVVREGDEVETLAVEAEEMLSFEPVEFAGPGGMQVRLAPCRWDALTVSLPGAEVADWAPLASWFREWFRDEDDGAGELLGVVHFLSDPQQGEAGPVFFVDLGSAPLEAFDALLSAVAALGVSHVEIGEPESD